MRVGGWFRRHSGNGTSGRKTSSRSNAAATSASESKFTRFSPTYFFVRQCLFVLIGLVLALFVFDTSVRTWERIASYVFIVALVLVVLVLIPGIRG